jgi:threonine aldolase
VIKVRKPIDLRSDTVTKPSEEMRNAMRDAEVGDDYYLEDPTVIKLQEVAAEKLGKEAALLVASGTMGNAVSFFTLTNPGELVIVETGAHVFRAETGHLGAISGVQVKSVDGKHGVMDPEDVGEALAVFPEATCYPRPSVICVENTHNLAGGTCWNPAQMRAMRQVADKHGLKVHVDGARIFNAAVAQQLDPKELTKDADTVQFCLTKGLAAPFGSLIAGSGEFIREARYVRQMMGGGMRQAGIMAAAGILALEKMVDRLAQDHENARLLAEELVNIGFEIDMESVQTNMVYVTGCPTGLSVEEWVAGLEKEGVRMNSPSAKLRLVTHYGITRDDIMHVVDTTAKLLGAQVKSN